MPSPVATRDWSTLESDWCIGKALQGILRDLQRGTLDWQTFFFLLLLRSDRASGGLRSGARTSVIACLTTYNRKCMSAVGPAEIAIDVSFYGTQNLKRKRLADSTVNCAALFVSLGSWQQQTPDCAGMNGWLNVVPQNNAFSLQYFSGNRVFFSDRRASAALMLEIAM